MPWSPGARSAGALSRRTPQRNSPIGRPGNSAAKIRPKSSKLQHTFWPATDPIPSHWRRKPIVFVATARQARAEPVDTVVWVNAKSHTNHFARTRNYGTTRDGAYMCEADARAAGDRAAMNEHHP